MSGGRIQTQWMSLPVDRVLRLDLNTKQWSKEPNLNQGRYLHSSCALSDTIFVFCGLTSNNTTPCNSIERLEVTDTNSESRQWQILKPAVSKFPVRFACKSIALNATEILIFGGMTDKE